MTLFNQIGYLGLEQEAENLKKKVAACTRENQNLQEELSEAYNIKGQMSDLHGAEVSKVFSLLFSLLYPHEWILKRTWLSLHGKMVRLLCNDSPVVLRRVPFEDEEVPWLGYSADDSLQQDYCSQLLPEISDVTTNEQPRQSLFGLMNKRGSSNKIIGDSHSVPVHNTVNFEQRNSSKVSQFSLLSSLASPKGQTPLPNLESGASDIFSCKNIYSNTPMSVLRDSSQSQVSAAKYQNSTEGSNFPGSSILEAKGKKDGEKGTIGDHRVSAAAADNYFTSKKENIFHHPTNAVFSQLESKAFGANFHVRSCRVEQFDNVWMIRSKNKDHITVYSTYRMRDKPFSGNLANILDIQLHRPSNIQKIDPKAECGICYAPYLPIDCAAREVPGNSVMFGVYEALKQYFAGGMDTSGAVVQWKRKMTTENQVNDIAKTVAATNVSTMSHTSALQAMAPAEKPKKFTNVDFKRWQQKMFFYLTTLYLQRFTSKEDPEVPKGTSDQEKFVVTEA
ncbi:putative hydrophobic protein LTI6A-like [Capsicum annuum]|nr:putative hydrophobic protein LTI6A-like [Capsicum annuum]